jgi:hypothetical protein
MLKHGSQPMLNSKIMHCSEPGCSYSSLRKDHYKRHLKLVHKTDSPLVFAELEFTNLHDFDTNNNAGGYDHDLITAAREGHEAVAQGLLAKCALRSVTPFLAALEHRWMTMVSIFLPHLTVDLMSQKDTAHSKTALHWAAEIGSTIATSRCLELRASVDAQDRYGETALHYAAENGHLHIVKTLVSAGSDPRVCDNHQRTPLSCALGEGPGLKRKRHQSIVEYLTYWDRGNSLEQTKMYCHGL